jgi:uncharacterized membrane protein
MRHAALRLIKTLVCLTLMASPFVIHAALKSQGWQSLAEIGGSLQVLASVWIVLTLVGARAKLLLAVLISTGICLLLYTGLARGYVLPPGLLHAAIYVALLLWFKRSLAQGQEPVISRFARIMRGGGALPVEIEVYTRRVTIAWCLFCAAQLLASLTLLLFAPVYVWTLFISVLNLPMIVLMFLCEYGYRIWRLSNYTHEKPTDMLRLISEVRIAALSRSGG